MGTLFVSCIQEQPTPEMQVKDVLGVCKQEAYEGAGDRSRTGKRTRRECAHYLTTPWGYIVARSHASCKDPTPLDNSPTVPPSSTLRE
jgi:hypothetical protein